MRSDSAGIIRAIILGNDAVLAAQPAEPIQLARACLRAGFDFVVPVSWGDELLATRVADIVGTLRPPAVIVASCPFVAESLRARPARAPSIASVSPPVATARYLRRAFPNRTLYITYVGACPGASAPDIDGRLLPDVLLGWFIEAGIKVERQPCHFDGLIPPDRARHASIPGGLPHPAWLADRVDATEVEVTPATVDSVAAMPSDRTVVLDLGVACGCVCARDRIAAARLDPPRSTSPVVLPLNVELSEGRLLPAPQLLDAPSPVSAGPGVGSGGRETRATFVERGLSDVDALRPPEPLTSPLPGASPGPRISVADRPALAGDVQSMQEILPNGDGADSADGTAQAAMTPVPPASGRMHAPR
ncbi:MAG TPA: hypothetical protein VF981_01215 [Gemmatimonadaceae bacterium]